MKLIKQEESEEKMKIEKETKERIRFAIHIARQCTDFRGLCCSNKDCKNKWCVLQGERK